MTKAGRRSGSFTHSESLGRGLLSPLLRKIGNRIDATTKIAKSAKGPKKAANLRISDERVIEILVRHFHGETMVALGLEYGVHKEVILKWKSGVSRKHLLDRAEALVRAEEGKSP